jgi:hypothetical protein
VTDVTELPTDTTTSPVDAPVETAAPAEAVSDEATLLGDAGTETPEASDSAEGEEQPAEGAPEAYELSLKDEAGEDIPLDPVMLAEATEVFKEFNLTNEQANKLVPLGHKMMQQGMQAAEEQLVTAVATQKKAWLEEFRADEDIGGSKADETLHLAAKGLDALGYKQGHPFRELLDASGLGNHRDMIAAFRRIGEVVSEEGTFANPDGASEAKTVGWADRYKDDE